MKNLKEVEKEIASLIKRSKEKDCEAPERKKIAKRVELLNLVRYYLEKDPREQFCKDERDRLRRIMVAALKSWDNEYQKNREELDKLPMKRITEMKNAFLKEVPMALMRMQVKTLDYILS